MPITDEDRQHIIDLFQKISDEVGEQYNKAVTAEQAKNLQRTHVVAVQTIAAENTIRVVIETMLNQIPMYQEDFLAELALRTASLLISGAPIKSHGHLSYQVGVSMPAAVERKVANGGNLRTDWVSETGVKSKNVPDKRGMN